MIYATIDVTLQTHPRAIAAGFEAMGLWLFGMLYAHQHETDGTVHRAAVLAAWGGRRNVMLAKKLVEVGLWTELETGDWLIHNYDKKNQKAEDIKRKREQKAIRQDRWRRRVSNASTPSHVDASTRDARDATDQIRSDQNKADQIRSDLKDPPIGGSYARASAPPPPPETGVREKLPEVTADRPAWFDQAADTVEGSTGAVIDRPAAWLRYSGHRKTNGKTMGQPDAVYWLTAVDVQEARKRRDEVRRQEDRDRARNGPTAPPRPSKEQSRAFAAELAARVLEGRDRKAGGS